MKKGYIQTYEWVMSLLAKNDFEESAARLGLSFSAPGTISIDFLTRTYSVTKESIEKVCERVKWQSCAEGYEFNLKSVLGYYILSEAKVEPVNEFCPLQHFSHGVFRNDDGRRDPLRIAFGQDFHDSRRLSKFQFVPF
ncbi:MAG: hypothetical protein Pg6A_20760 [Termitinemataceae bacterium]|nr:MAG: hypothetical protein Pg6A_20760 [Termitinemataceae bacterium]